MEARLLLRDEAKVVGYDQRHHPIHPLAPNRQTRTQKTYA